MAVDVEARMLEPGRGREARWVSLGAIVATVLWLAASLALVSMLAILVGAEINAELEAQTAIDSTVGTPKPMGERGAEKADTLGESYR